MDEMMRTALLTLADLIDKAMNSEDEIDRTYLLEAVQSDLRQLAFVGSMKHVQELIDNPVS